MMSTLPRRRLVAQGAAVLAAVAGGWLAVHPAGLASARETVSSDPRLTLLDLTNAERARQGLSALRDDPALAAIAEARATAQVGRSELSHADAEGRPAFAVLMQAAGLAYRAAGENLARVAPADAAAARRAAELWMGSAGHRGNILDPAFDRIGIGAATDSGGAIFVQVFRAAAE